MHVCRSQILRMGPVLDWCVPGDANAYVEGVLHLVCPTPGRACSPSEATLMFLLQGIKWPPCVRKFCETIGTRDVLLEMTAAKLVEFFVDLLRWAHEKVGNWATMFRTMNTGTMWSKSGLVYSSFLHVTIHICIHTARHLV